MMSHRGYRVSALVISLMLYTPQPGARQTPLPVGTLSDREKVNQDFDCRLDPERMGALKEDEIHLASYSEPGRENQGITLTSDSESGVATSVSLPTRFQYGKSVLDRYSLKTPGGNFKVVMRAKLAGINALGRWLGVTTAVRLEAHEGDENGLVVAQGILEKSFGAPGVYTIETSYNLLNLRPGSLRSYFIKIDFHKDDGRRSNDGSCGIQIKVEAL